MDMPRAADGRRNSHEHRADQQVARDLLGPRGRTVQHIARKELVEDVEAQQPEESKRRPVLDQVFTKFDRCVFDVKMPFGVKDMFAGRRCRSGFGHRGFLQPGQRMPPAVTGAASCRRDAASACASLDCDDLVVVGLGEAHRLDRRILEHGVGEALAVDLHDLQALLLELFGELRFALLDLFRRPRRRFTRHFGEDLLLVIGQLVPHVRRDLRGQTVDDMAAHHDRLLHFVELLRFDRGQRVLLRIHRAILQREIDLGERDRRRVGTAGLRCRHVSRDVRHPNLRPFIPAQSVNAFCAVMWRAP